MLAVSMGDPAGIGAEIVVAAAHEPKVRRVCRLVVFGDAKLLDLARAAKRIPTSSASAIVDVVEPIRSTRRSGWPRAGRRTGEAAFRYLEAAATAVASGQYDGLVTAPLNKYWLHRAGHPYDGHTDYLSKLSGHRAVMMLAGRRLRVVLATTHVALARVPELRTPALIRRCAPTAVRHLRRYAGLRRPRLAVAALNPPAGAGGSLGDEERRIITPALRSLRRKGIVATGPLPADTLFAAAAAGDYDAVLCMYHDQALIPLKLLEFGRAVNVSMGLPFIRTSPDHGTAYDLAGTGSARSESMREAILAAAEMARHSVRREQG